MLDYLLDMGGGLSSVAVLGGGGAVVGEPVTVEGVKETSPDLDDNYVSQKVTEIKPESTPIDTIMRNVGSPVKINSFETEFYSVSHKLGKDVLTAAVKAVNSGSPIVEIPVGNVENWSKDDTILVHRVKGYDKDGNPVPDDLVLLVVGRIPGASKLQCQAVNGKKDPNNPKWTLCPDIPSGTELTRMGNAKNEIDAQTEAFALLPSKDSNYCQIFMAQVEESVYQAMHKQEIKWGYADYSRQNIYEMKKRMELSFLFGHKAKVYDALERDEKYLTGGIVRYIPKRIQYGVSATDLTVKQDNFIDYTKEIFTGNSGSDTRILVAGSELLAQFAKVDTIRKQLEAKNTEVVFGIKFNVIETNFGRLLVRHHELLNQAGWGKKGLVLDVNNLEKQAFLPMTTRGLDLQKSGIRNTTAHIITEASCIITRYPETHAIFEPKV